MKKYLFLTSLLLLSLHHFRDSEAAIQCSDVIKDLTPCIGYLRTGSGSPTTACCGGISTLVSAASTTADRRTACNCIVSAVPMIKPNITAALALPKRCGITLPSPLPPNLDCSKIS